MVATQRSRHKCVGSIKLNPINTHVTWTNVTWDE
jgi:hypothetical protein